jgi:hypothetical protein
MADLASADMPTAIRDLQRLLYSLDAILRLHFAQEEEIYHLLTGDGSAAALARGRS